MVRRVGHGGRADKAMAGDREAGRAPVRPSSVRPAKAPALRAGLEHRPRPRSDPELRKARPETGCTDCSPNK